jgi:integrase
MLEQRVITYQFRWERGNFPASLLGLKSERSDIRCLICNERNLAAPVHQTTKIGQQLHQRRVIRSGDHLDDFDTPRNSSYSLEFLDQFGIENLGIFRTEWTHGPCSSLKKLERLRAFFHFAQQRKWVVANPANGLKAPKVPVHHTMPFTREEMIRILAALDVYAETAGTRNAQRLRAFILLLRYSGMRIGDAVQCAESRISDDRLFLYTQKTGVPVYWVLPSFVVEALNATPRSTEGLYFWSGTSKLHGSVGKWQARLKRLCEIAKVPKGHAHRSRDTFAVELLLAGVPIERVSVLLGHQSIRVTERHYAPWTKSRQEQLECDLKRAWSEDPVAISQLQGTRQVHGKTDTIN